MVNINRRYNVINARAFKARALFFFFTAFSAGRLKTPHMNIKRIFIHFYTNSALYNYTNFHNIASFMKII